MKVYPRQLNTQSSIGWRVVHHIRSKRKIRDGCWSMHVLALGMHWISTRHQCHYILSYVRDSSIESWQSIQSLRSRCKYQTKEISTHDIVVSVSEGDSRTHLGKSALDFPSGASQPQKQPEDLQTPSKRPESRLAAWKSLHHVHVRQT
jgi:hypothetical protein